LEAFKQRNQVSSLEEQRSLLLKQRMELDTGLKNTKNSIDELKQRLSTLRTQMTTISEDKDRFVVQTERDRIIVETKAKLLDLKLKEQQLLEKYKESNRLVTNVRKEIGLVSDFLRQQEEDTASKAKKGNMVYQGVEIDAIKTEADLNSQLAKERAIKLQLSQADREIQSINLNEKELVGLKREVSNIMSEYHLYIKETDEVLDKSEINDPDKLRMILDSQERQKDLLEKLKKFGKQV